MTTDDTTPPPTPGDALMGRVINFVGAVVVLCVLAITALAGTDKAIPQILETVATAAVTALGTLLAARSRT